MPATADLTTSAAHDLIAGAVAAIAPELERATASYVVHGYDDRGWYSVRTADQTYRTGRKVAARLIDGDPGCGLEVYVATGNGVILAEATIALRVSAGTAPAIIALITDLARAGLAA
jgi:hypothetical protein